MVPTITAIEESVTIAPTRHRKWKKVCFQDKVENGFVAPIASIHPQ